MAEAVRRHLGELNVETRFAGPGPPWENGYIESVNGTLRNELLSREVFGHLLEARVPRQKYRQEYNTERPHSSLDYQTLAEMLQTALPTPPSPRHQPNIYPGTQIGGTSHRTTWIRLCPGSYCSIGQFNRHSDKYWACLN